MKTNYIDYQDDSYLDELAEENLKRKYNKKKKKIKDKVNIKEENIDTGGNDDHWYKIQKNVRRDRISIYL